jgi:serine kinase of HPr protein (carbohydrate metabolism regulator)
MNASMPSANVHATAVALDGIGVLLQGPPGSGKSDLALRLIEGGASLIADDRTELFVKNDRLFGRAPPSLADLIEVRGLGIARLPAMGEAPISLVVELVAPDVVERQPESATLTLLGVAIPVVRLAPFEASAPAKIRLAVRQFAKAP